MCILGLGSEPGNTFVDYCTIFLSGALTCTLFSCLLFRKTTFFYLRLLIVAVLVGGAFFYVGNYISYLRLYFQTDVVYQYSGTISAVEIPNPFQAAYRLLGPALEYFRDYYFIHIPSIYLAGAFSYKLALLVRR